MKRSYTIAVALAILTAAGLSGAWLLSGSTAGAASSVGDNGIDIVADSPEAPPGAMVGESGNSSPQQQEKVTDTGTPATPSAQVHVSKNETDKYSRIPDGESVKGRSVRDRLTVSRLPAAPSPSPAARCCAIPNCRCRCLARMTCPNLILP